ncbi:MAG: hypothetical protein JSR96_13000 [Proteobacteria bacterium]|nr:hypothetical protein [Pseudomonadota bacterium]
MSAALTLFLAVLLLASALHKVAARDRLAMSAARLAGAPLPLGQPLLFAALSIEALAGAALLVAPLHQAGAVATGGLWTLYAITLIARRGQVLDCGCDLFSREKPVDAFAIARPLGLALLAFTLAVVPKPAWTVDAPFAAIALLALWFAAGELAQLPHLARISRR